MDINRIKKGLGEWFQSHYHIEPFKDLVTKKEVPRHKYSVWYYFGGITLFLFITQIITGILLLFYYKPSAAAAFESVKFIMTKVEFGWLIRSIHAWSANLMIFTVFVHLFSTFFLQAYRPPRELTWVTGVFLFFLTLGTGFTGYLLPWNELSFFATKVGTQIAGSVPVIGSFLRTILRGGEEVSDATLGRFFAFHVIVLPLGILAILGLHLMFVQLQGMSRPLSVKDEEKKSIPFFPNFLLRDTLAWVFALGFLATLAVYLPAELGKKVDPFAPTPAGIKPEWYFLWMFQSLKLIPGKVLMFDGEVLGILCFGAMGLGLLLLPFIDIWSRREKRSLFFKWLGIIILAFIIFMTVWGISLAQTAFAEQPVNYCVQCHKSLDDKRLSEPAILIEGGAHVKAGLSCADCHGGDPSSDDISISMDPAKGYIGKPKRNEIPNFCARCHSDASYMKKYNPNIATDQLSKYQVSQHGKLNSQGDKKVAVCINCHNVHQILPANNPASPTYATNLPGTCARCHADKEYMKEYGIPTDQFDEYKQSVHGQALLVKGDRSSPSCKDCHGNHDAGLPRAIYVGNICSQCHALTYELFSKSPHKAAHDKLGIPECEVCHGNHKILKPTDDMLGTGKDAVCINCHDPSSKGFNTASTIKNSIEDLKAEINNARQLNAKAEQLGMEDEDAVFDMNEANNSLTKARTYIHSFSDGQVNSIVNEGGQLAKKAQVLSKKAIDDFNFRRRGYALAIVLVFIFCLALYLRIKIMEKDE